MNPLSLRLLTLLLISFCTHGHAEFYKWVDENGKTHFSDNPHEKGKAEPIEIEPATKIGTVKPQSARHLFEKDFSKHQQKQQERKNQAEKRRQKKAALRKACDDSKQALVDAIQRRTGASSPSSKRYHNEKIALAKEYEDEACKLSNFR